MKVLMVCLGNICRSPMAEGILRKKAEEANVEIVIDSAGTGAWHIGEHPDKRAVKTASKFGVDISKLKARQVSEKDFEEFDRIYVMDDSNYSDVLRFCNDETYKHKVQLLLNVDKPNSNRPVPDPYYGGEIEFENVFRMMEQACIAIIGELKKTNS